MIAGMVIPDVMASEMHANRKMTHLDLGVVSSAEKIYDTAFIAYFKIHGRSMMDMARIEKKLI